MNKTNKSPLKRSCFQSEYSRERVGTRLTPSPCDTPTQLVASKIASTLVNSQQKKKENAVMNNGASTPIGIGKDNGLVNNEFQISDQNIDKSSDFA